jgi:unsaturated rhamnogalacturonyl hydrolase
MPNISVTSNKVVDQFVDYKGNIRTYKLDDYNLDMITPGRLLLTVYHETSKEKYRLAADNLMKQLHEQPRTKEGGFWHKNAIQTKCG